VEVDGTPCGFAFCLTDSLHVLLSCAFLLTFYFIPFYRVGDTLFTQCGPQNINQVQMGFVQKVCLENHPILFCILSIFLSVEVVVETLSPNYIYTRLN